MRLGSAHAGVHRGAAAGALLVGSVALAACGGGGGAGAAGQDASASSSGANADVCAQALSLLEQRVSPDPAMIKPGDWGSTPAVLQKLPPDGVLCGSVVEDAGSAGTVILTRLTGRALFDFYAPLLTAVGCPPGTGNNDGPVFICVCADARPASIDATDPAHAYIVLSV
jgi:hypothetical protein